MLEIRLNSRYQLSTLGGMINASVNSRSCKTVNQNWLGQLGTINIPVALSEIIFCNTFTMLEKGENSKMTNYAMKHKMHLSPQLLGLVDKQKIEGVGNLF